VQKHVKEQTQIAGLPPPTFVISSPSPLSAATYSIKVGSYSGDAAPMKFCLEPPEQLPDIGDYRSYKYVAHVSGSAAANADGYWLIAVDSTHAAWAQVGGSFRDGGGNISERLKFGVSNVSSYPLQFVLISTGGNLSYDEVKERARDGTYLSEGDVASRAVSDMDACLVDLKNDVPVIPKACACP
jgi:hypothetical protein